MNFGTKSLALMCLALGVFLYFYRKRERKTGYLCVTVITAFVFAVALYWDHLFGDTPFLYTTIDGFSQYLPKYMEYVHTFESGEGLPWWSFSIGLGSVQSYDVLLYPMNLIPVLCGVVGGEGALITGFVWMQVAKIVLAAFFMHLFLKKIGLDGFVCYVFAIVYSFCGIMILRGNWVFLADECYIAVLLLWAVERFFKDGKWGAIPAAIFLLCCCLGVYYAYLYALLLIAYTTVRFAFSGQPIKKYLPYLLFCGVLFLLGVLLWAIVLVGFSWTMFITPRFASTRDRMSLGMIMQTTDWEVLLSAMFSAYDPGVTGVFDQYTGALNYLERPLFYCGIGCLYLIPQALIYSKGRSRKLICVGILAATLYMVFPFVADIFNAFIQNEEMGARSYRLSSLWIVIVMVVTAAYGLHCAIQNKKLHELGLLVTGVVLITLFLYLIIVAESYQIIVNLNVVRWCMLFLLGWLVFLLLYSAAGSNARVQRAWLAVFFCIASFESIHSARNTINAASAFADLTYQNMCNDTTGYYGDMKAAMEYIKQKDDGLYRVAGARMNVGAATYCSPMYFGIFDSSYYTDINGATYEFINEVYPESFISGLGAKYSIGIGDNLYLGTVTGYKYLVVNNLGEYEMPFGYRKLTTIGEYDVLENELALSFGITYDSYITQSDFEDYSDEEQRMLLLRAVVLADDAQCDLPRLDKESIEQYLAEAEEDELASYETEVLNRRQGMLQVESWKADHIVGTVCATDDQILSFAIPNVPGWNVYVDGEKAELVETNVGFFGVELEEGEHTIELRYEVRSFYVGLIISAVAMAAYVVLLASRKRIKTITLEKKAS